MKFLLEVPDGWVADTFDDVEDCINELKWAFDTEFFLNADKIKIEVAK